MSGQDVYGRDRFDSFSGAYIAPRDRQGGIKASGYGDANQGHFEDVYTDQTSYNYFWYKKNKEDKENSLYINFYHQKRYAGYMFVWDKPEVKLYGNPNSNGQGVNLEYEKYGKIIGAFNVSGSLSLGGGIAGEFGYVVTDKRFAQYYYTIYAMTGFSASLSGNFVAIQQLGNIKPTLKQTWEGDCSELGGNIGAGVLQIGGDQAGTIRTMTMGIGTGWSWPSMNWGAGGSSGITHLIGSPIDLNPPKDFFTNWYSATHGY